MGRATFLKEILNQPESGLDIRLDLLSDVPRLQEKDCGGPGFETTQAFNTFLYRHVAAKGPYTGVHQASSSVFRVRHHAF